MLDKITCETLIHFLAGTRELEGLEYPTIDRSDYNLINSFSRQLARHVGFTDRQYDLAKTKIDYYADQLSGIDLELAKNTLEIPLREIDRARWIDIVDHQGPDRVYEASKSPFIAIRFTFSKKLISTIETLKRRIENAHWDYDKENKVHYIKYTERNLYDVLTSVEGKNFELSDRVKEIYNKLINFKPEDYIPGVYNLEVKNLPAKGLKLLEQEVGETTIDNLYLYRDRSIRYGLDYFDEDDLNKSLEQISPLANALANRKNRSVIVNREFVDINDLMLSLESLNRLPVIIVLPSSDAHDVLVELHQQIRNIIPSEDICTMFRMDNTNQDGSFINEYIRKEKINNKLAKNIKVVYTLENKVPKPLINADFDPMSLVVYSSHSSIYSIRKVLGCFEDKDLIVHYSTKNSKSSNYFYDRNIETINVNM
jgi:predicted double-glycine peptidase